MRLIEIPNCDYQTFYAIRLEILRKVPHSLLNSEYLKEDSIAYFYLWDSDYIPEVLMKYRVQPPHEKESFDFSHINLPKE